MNKTFEQLEKELEIASKERDEASNKLIHSTNSYHEYEAKMDKYNQKWSKIDQQVRLLKPITELEDLDANDHVMTLEEFKSCVRDGLFTDYDGYGNYVQGDKSTGIKIYASDVPARSLRTDCDKIVWYNK